MPSLPARSIPYWPALVSSTESLIQPITSSSLWPITCESINANKCCGLLIAHTRKGPHSVTQKSQYTDDSRCPKQWA